MGSLIPNAGRKDDGPGSGISLETLIIASLASAAASFAASRFWGKGTLISAAATPVVVALVSEFLRWSRPRRHVEPRAANTPSADPGTIKYYKTDSWRPRWRPALVTGLIAFAIVVALYTVPDLLAGRSITGNGQPTTFFGGSADAKQKTRPTTTMTTTTPTTTTTKTATTTTTGATLTTNSSTLTTTHSSTALTTSATTNTSSTITPTTSTTPPTVSLTTTQTTPAP
ncbi:MAG: hypothetical protein ABSG43_24515 [Solirubrobacteraceae bacterium]